MADQARLKSELLNIFADGQNPGSISEQDLRDLIMSIYNPKDGIVFNAGTINNAGVKLTDGDLSTISQSGSIEYSNEHFYLTDSSRKAVDLSVGVKTTTATVANDATEQLLYSYNMLANTLHANERILADISGSYSNATATDDFNIVTKMNGVVIHTLSRVGGNVTNSAWKLQVESTIRTSGVAGDFIDSIIFLDGINIISEALSTVQSIDTTIDNLFEVYVQWNLADLANTLSCTQGHISFRH